MAYKSKAKYPIKNYTPELVMCYGGFRANGSGTVITPSGVGFNFFRLGPGVYDVYFDKYGDPDIPTNIIYSYATCKSGLSQFYDTITTIDNTTGSVRINTFDFSGNLVDPLGTISIVATLMYSKALGNYS